MGRADAALPAHVTVAARVAALAHAKPHDDRVEREVDLQDVGVRGSARRRTPASPICDNNFVFDLLDAPTALAACCGFDLCHKYILYLYLYLYLFVFVFVFAVAVRRPMESSTASQPCGDCNHPRGRSLVGNRAPSPEIRDTASRDAPSKSRAEIPGLYCPQDRAGTDVQTHRNSTRSRSRSSSGQGGIIVWCPWPRRVA
jgi:hypothetical protein